MWELFKRNRLLELVFVEELERGVVEAMRSVKLPEIMLPEEAKVRTKTIDDTPGTITGWFDVLRTRNEGVLIEALLVSDKTDYSVYIETDSLTIRKTFDELNQISDYVNSIAAFQNDDSYILHINDIKFSWLNFRLIANSVNFNRIYVKWEEVVV